jgi:gp16 family phage-associated protein
MTTEAADIRAETLALRGRRFRAALRLRGITMRQWAQDAGFTDVHVLRVLRGDSPSPALNRMIDATIERAFLPGGGV